MFGNCVGDQRKIFRKTKQEKFILEETKGQISFKKFIIRCPFALKYSLIRRVPSDPVGEKVKWGMLRATDHHRNTNVLHSCFTSFHVGLNFSCKCFQ